MHGSQSATTDRSGSLSHFIAHATGAEHRLGLIGPVLGRQSALNSGLAVAEDFGVGSFHSKCCFCAFVCFVAKRSWPTKTVISSFLFFKRNEIALVQGLDLFSAFWTGAEMIIFDGFQHVGGLYNPSMDRWISMSVPNPVPAPRSGYSAVWTGEDLIVWGGISDELGSSRFKNEGWRYSPRGNHWTELPLQGAPSPRRDAAAVWTGSEMIVWGGRGWGVDQTVQLDTGGVYNLSSDTWRATDSANAPPPSGYGLSAVWTGSEMLVLGDWGYTVWSYRPGRVMYLYTSP